MLLLCRLIVNYSVRAKSLINVSENLRKKLSCYFDAKEVTLICIDCPLHEHIIIQIRLKHICFVLYIQMQIKLICNFPDELNKRRKHIMVAVLMALISPSLLNSNNIYSFLCKKQIQCVYNL